jgi:hypothetical protein
MECRPRALLGTSDGERRPVALEGSSCGRGSASPFLFGTRSENDSLFFLTGYIPFDLPGALAG